MIIIDFISVTVSRQVALWIMFVAGFDKEEHMEYTV